MSESETAIKAGKYNGHMRGMEVIKEGARALVEVLCYCLDQDGGFGGGGM